MDRNEIYMIINPIEDVKLENSQLGRYLANFSELPGWFGPESIAIWDSLLTFQKSSGRTGNFLEIGVWRGKSAALSTLHSRPDESCVLLDPVIPIDVKMTMSKIDNTNVVYAEMCSRDLIRSGALTNDSGKFRWIHIDGEHTGMAIMSDLNIANALLNEEGVVVLDDFFSAGYPQITAAVFDWLNRNPRQLQLFLMGFNKGYLCRPRCSDIYLSYVEKSLYNDMVFRNHPGVTIWKTTTRSDMNSFGITERFEDFDYRGPDWDQRTIQI